MAGEKFRKWADHDSARNEKRSRYNALSVFHRSVATAFPKDRAYYYAPQTPRSKGPTEDIKGIGGVMFRYLSPSGPAAEEKSASPGPYVRRGYAVTGWVKFSC
ncbi:hypothetical protein TNCV_4592961 [Trichonephila clavipes]|nr:hypothetical protein TNCV_4592961 [Trichonephila clavipes]